MAPLKKTFETQVGPTLGKDAVDKANVELNKQGVPVNRTDKALTPEQRRANEQDAERAKDTARAQEEGLFKEELAPMKVTRGILDKKTGEIVGKEEHVCDRDECNRPDTTLDGLAGLKPYFDQTSGRGTVTAGNASGINDGAAALFHDTEDSG